MQGGSRRRCGGAAGATLVELVAVLLVLGVLVLASFRQGYASNATLLAESHRLRSHLRYAQALSMANNTDSWGIDVATEGYSLRKNGALAPVDLPGDATALHVFAAGIRVSSGTGLVLFDEWGSPGASSVAITLSDGTHTCTITLLAQTGYQT